MNNWIKFINADKPTCCCCMMDQYGIYPDSLYDTNDCRCFMAKETDSKVLVVTGGSRYDEFTGDELVVEGKSVKVCPLTIENSKLIREIFPFTNPTSSRGRNVSIGLGDRLGLASAGHLRLIKDKDVFPILAQQSIRELNLTNRTYEDVLASAVWAVLQEGYEKGYGADGDHLKTPDDINMALKFGFTMITLDCSEHIDNNIEALSKDAQKEKYQELPQDIKTYWENKYLNKKFDISSSLTIKIDEAPFMKTVLTYLKAIDFAESIYNNILKDYDREIDFEISIDETLTSTSLVAHYIIAAELRDRDVEILNMAPRFCGEFQKGIDYRGDKDEFTKEFEYHSAIADHFGYKLSVHSGSDKFSIFPIIGDKTNFKFHLKTAGTNWLEALRVIANENPELFKGMYNLAISKLPEAKTYYHIFTEVDMIPDINDYAPDKYNDLLEIEESRQALHVTYGYLLCEKDADNNFIYRNQFSETMHKYEDEYYKVLQSHIGRHLNDLGL